MSVGVRLGGSARRRSRQQLLEALGITLLVFVPLLIAGNWRDAVISGDPYAVYFPFVRAVFRGDGLLSVATLLKGPGRPLLYPLFITLAAIPFDDLALASRVVGAATSGLVVGGTWVVLRANGAQRATALAASLLVVTNPVFIRGAFEPLPDSMFLAMLVWGIWWLQFGSTRSNERRHIAVLGALVSLSLMVRINGLLLLGLVPFAFGLPRRGYGKRAIGATLVGTLLALSPLLAVSGFMAMNRLSFPRIYVAGLSKSGSGSSALVESIFGGLLDILPRIAALNGWLMTVLGFIAIFLGLRSRDHRGLATIALCVGAAMAAFLIPIHFEARYYFFSLPILAGAVCLVAQAGAERVGRGWLGWGAMALLVGAMAKANIPLAIAEAEQARQLRTEMSAICGALPASTESRTLVGANPRVHLYTAARYCPRPTARGTSSPILAPTNDPQDLGPTYWIDRFGGPLVQTGETLAQGGGLTVVRRPPPVLRKTVAPTSAASEAITIRMNVPRKARWRCDAMPLSLDAGRYVLSLTTQSPAPIVTTWTLTGSTSISRSTTDTDAFTLTMSDPKKLGVCLADTHIAKGDVTVTMEIHRAPQ